MKRILAFLTVLMLIAGARAQEAGPGGHYYQVVMEQLTWAQAKARAEGMVFNGVHGHLATITSAEEDQFIEGLRQVAAPGGYQSLWVGGYQDERAFGMTDGWMWVNGEGAIPMSGDGAYSNWQPTEPNDYWGPNSEMFLSVGHFNMFGWNDEPNDMHVLGFVVEYPSGGTQTVVRITTIDAFAVENAAAQVPNTALFEVRREGEMALDLPVFYSIHGTASNGGDYDEISRSVIIPAGQAVAHIMIRPRADALAMVEPLETVGIRLEPSPILSPQASYRIDATKREAGAVIAEGQAPANGAIEIAVPRNGFVYNEGEAVTLLAVAYSTEELVQATFVEGGMDVGTVVWESRQGNIFFYRTTMQNPLPGTHTVKVMARTPSSVLLESSNVTFTLRGEVPLAVVGIQFVNVETAEPVPNADYAPGYFQVTRSGGNMAADLQVYYSIGGSAQAGIDYEALPGYVVIAANRTSARINIVAIDDLIDEPNESVILGLNPDEPQHYTLQTGATAATAVIYDNDEPSVPTISIDFTIGDISEPNPNGAPTETRIIVRRSAAQPFGQRVYLGYGGTATPGADFTPGIEQVIIPAGQAAVEYSLHSMPDNLREPEEYARIRILPHETATPGDAAGGAYRIDREDGAINVSIQDNGAGNEPTVTIFTPEAGASFYAGSPITIGALAIDPAGLFPRVEFYAGATKIGESRVEWVQQPPAGSQVEHVIVWRTAPVGRHVLQARGFALSGRVVASRQVTIDVVEDTTTPIVYITPATAEIAETPINGYNSSAILTVRRNGNLTYPLRVRLDYSGSAFRGADFMGPDAVVLAAGAESVQFTISAVQDNVAEGLENALVILAPYDNAQDPDPANRPYTVANTSNRSNIQIHDTTGNGMPVVSLLLITPDTREPRPNEDVSPAVFALRRTGSTAQNLSVYVAYSGSATAGADYDAPGNWLVIPAGQVERRFEIYAKNDAIQEGDETIIAMQQTPPVGAAVATYQIDPEHRNATMTIHDLPPNEGPNVVRITAPDNTATEFPANSDGYDSAFFRISRSGSTAHDLRVYYSIHGTAMLGEDYNGITDSVLIPAGQEFAVVEIIPLPESNGFANHYEIVSTPGLSWQAAKAAAEGSVYAGAHGHLATITSADEDARIEQMRLNAGGGGAFWVGGYQEADETSITGGWKWVNNEGTIPGTNEQPGYANWLQGEPNDYWGVGSENHMVIGWLNAFGWNDQGENVGAQGYVVEYEIPTPVPPVAELMETVGLRLVPSPAENPLPSYEIDANAHQAAVVIFENGGSVGAVEIAIPSAGDLMRRPVEFLAAAYHPQQQLGTVDFYVDGNKVGTSSLILPAIVVGGMLEHSFTWTAATPGQHVLVAKAMGPNGTEFVSQGTPFVVEGVVENVPPQIAITHPTDGAVILEDESANIVVEAGDVDGTVARIELYADGNLLTTTTTPTLNFAWLNPPVGPHVFRARATDNLGATTMSAEVRILVRATDALAFVRRSLPAGYSPGAAFAVSLRAEPPAGAHAYAVEDQPPRGWTVSSISHDGVFDGVTGKVKFGPFTDAEARTLTYRVMPPANATGRQQFMGASSLNGTPYPIAGDEFIEQARPHHPADRDENLAIVLNEVTAYAAAWKAGESWPAGPSPIPLSYVTSAGTIWRRGEAYRFDPSLGSAPACWAPVAGEPQPMRAAAVTAMTVTTAQRSVSGELRSGAAAQVTITVAPGTGTSSYAIEERPPLGWTISNVSSGGVYDAESGVIRWGLFLDANSRLFSYTVTPPAVASTGGFSGQVSADGRIYEILSSGSTANTATAPIALSSPAASGGAIVMTIRGPQGQTGVLEATSDFIEWAPVRQVFLPNGELEIVDETPAPEGHRFYRLRVD